MDRIAALVDEMFVRGIGSGAALSIGDAGREVERMYHGSTRRLPVPGRPIDEHTWFDVASLTKPIATVASAMVLVGDGALDLDEPVRRWIPTASTTGTVAQLLGHGAGCAAHVEFFKRLRVGDHPDPRAELIAMAATEPATAPGVATVYSDLGYIMLGAIVERAAGVPLEQAFAALVAEPLGLTARYAGMESIDTTAEPNVAATELDDRTGVQAVVQGRVHDENAWYSGGVCGHAGLFARIDDIARFAIAILDTAAGTPRGRLRTDVVTRFLTSSAAPDTTWRLGWDTPSHTPGVSAAGDRWPRAGSAGHMGFTGVSLWLDLPHRRWVSLLTNRVHPTRFGDTADAIKALRRGVNDAALDLLERR